MTEKMPKDSKSAFSIVLGLSTVPLKCCLSEAVCFIYAKVIDYSDEGITLSLRQPIELGITFSCYFVRIHDVSI